MNRLSFAGVVLAGVTAFMGMPAMAQVEDSPCFYQDASGRVIDLADLCGAGRPDPPPQPMGTTPSPLPARPTAPSSPASRMAQCQQLREAFLQNPISGQIIPQPSTSAERDQNVQISGALQQMARAIATLPLSDATLQNLQDLAVQMHRDGSSLALAQNQAGVSPTQRQQFDLASATLRILTAAESLTLGFADYCGSALY